MLVVMALGTVDGQVLTLAVVVHSAGHQQQVAAARVPTEVVVAKQVALAVAVPVKTGGAVLERQDKVITAVTQLTLAAAVVVVQEALAVMRLVLVESELLHIQHGHLLLLQEAAVDMLAAVVVASGTPATLAQEALAVAVTEAKEEVILEGPEARIPAAVAAVAAHKTSRQQLAVLEL